MKQDRQIARVLLLLRVSVFLVMFVWTLAGLVRPASVASLFEPLHLLTGFDHRVLYGIAFLVLVILVSFLMGIQKQLSYGTVLALNAVWALSSFQQYRAPFSGSNLLSFAMWPMLAACFGLYVLRHLDTLWVIDKY
ncbi:MAG: hypothetical protein ACYDDO_03920 [Acidiferrobacterales bacterium]